MTHAGETVYKESLSEWLTDTYKAQTLSQGTKVPKFIMLCLASL